MTDDVDRVLRQRLAVQRLTSTPLRDPVDVVRELLCVQSQDEHLARFSIGLRTAGANDTDVLAALDAGEIVRTHILRPTWHFVAAADLRWLLALTSAKVAAGMSARRGQLGLDAEVIARAVAALADALSGSRALTRRDVATVFHDAGLPHDGEQVGHLLIEAELRGVVCSAPRRGTAHAYGLVDELIPRTPERHRDDAVRELVQRFFTGHGPAAVTDLTRWTTLTLAEIRPALADLADRLATTTVRGIQMWYDAESVRPTRRRERAFLLPTFDEIYMSYPKVNFPRAASHPRGDAPNRLEVGGGVVICDRRDAGWWKREVRPREVVVSVAVTPILDDDQRHSVVAAAERLGRFVGKPAHVQFVDQ
jgi:DNA glycosylase AlkZ-like